MPFRLSVQLAGIALAGLLSSHGAVAQATGAPVPALKDAFRGDFLVGAALNLDEVYRRDLRGDSLVRAQFNQISPENLLKWVYVQPVQGDFTFDAADRYVAYGERNGMVTIGHTLVWHSQTPRWVFQDQRGNPVSRDTLLSRMRQHIHTVVGRYRGRIRGWDVVNEALNEDGTLRQSPWLRIIGEDYIAKAFQFAHEADPQAELYYNDYSLERPAKRAGAVELVRKLRVQGIPVAGVGLQGHHNMTWPTFAAEDSTITAFAELGVRVHITELDIDVLPRTVRGNSADVSLRGGTGCGCEQNPWPTALPDSVQRALAERYAGFFRVYLKHRDVIDRITFWGVTDQDSWLNDWPVRGRTSYPLLFDRAGRPKPALEAVIREARQRSMDR